MSEHKAPRTGDRVGVTLRAKAREIVFTRKRAGTFTRKKLTPGSIKWRRFERQAEESFPSGHTLDQFYSLHGQRPKRKA